MRRILSAAAKLFAAHRPLLIVEVHHQQACGKRWSLGSRNFAIRATGKFPRKSFRATFWPGPVNARPHFRRHRGELNEPCCAEPASGIKYSVIPEIAHDPSKRHGCLFLFA